MIRIFLVDDHELVRRGIADVLEREPDLSVVGEAGTIRAALARVEATMPDLVVLDVRLPDGSGVDACRQIRSRHPEIPCVMLTAFDDDAALDAAVLAGARGWLLKDIRGAGLVDAVRSIAAGRDLIPDELRRRAGERLMRQQAVDQPGIEISLTLREQQVLALIADGRTNRQIGDRLGLAEKTVKNYVSGLLVKLGFQRRTQAAVYGADRGRR